MDILKDDHTKQYSLSRISIALSMCYLLAGAAWATYHKQALHDVPGGWVALIGLFYGLNKSASTVAEIKGPKNGA